MNTVENIAQETLQDVIGEMNTSEQLEIMKTLNQLNQAQKAKEPKKGFSKVKLQSVGFNAVARNILRSFKAPLNEAKRLGVTTKPNKDRIKREAKQTHDERVARLATFMNKQ